MTRTDTAGVHVPAATAGAFAALVDPAALVAWLPPDGMTGTLTDFVPGAGGRFRMVLTYRDPESADPKSGADEDVVDVRVAEVVEAARVVWEVAFDSDDPRFATDVPPGIDAADHQVGLRSSLRQLRDYVIGRPNVEVDG